MTMIIEGLGTAVPNGVLPQETAAEYAQRRCLPANESVAAHASSRARAGAGAAINGSAPPATKAARSGRTIARVFANSGIRERHLIVHDDFNEGSFYPPKAHEADLGPTTGERVDRYVEEAPALALRASRRAMEESSSDASAITHLVTVSCTGFHAPGFDVELMKQLGLDATTARTHVGFMGCHGVINGLRAAQAYVASFTKAQRALLCSVELSSLHLQYRAERDALVSNAIFSDGAAAAVVGRDDSNEDGASMHARPAVRATGSCVFPGSEEVMRWRVGDHGFEMTLSAQVPFLIGAHLRPWLASFLAAHEMTLEEVQSWAVHPGGPRVLDAVGEALGLHDEALDASRAVLADYGNMSSATVLFILDELRTRGAAGPCVMLAFGPGLTAEAALLQW